METKFRWRGSPVSCYNPGLQKGNFIFYKSFVINGEVYELGDFATVDITNTESVCRILCLYESNEKWHQKAKFRAIVRWYPFAKNLKKYFSEQMIDSGDTEVVEDRRASDIFLNLLHIVKKCRVIFAAEDEPEDYIERKRLNAKLFFLCRFKITDTGLNPVICNDNSLSETNICVVANNSPKRKSHCESPIKPKRRHKSYLDSDGENDVELIKAVKNIDLLSPTNKNSVKRNLNESFADITDSQSSTPILNYSVVDTSAESEELKLKLRRSHVQNPKVILKKLDDSLVECHLTKNVKPKQNDSILKQATPPKGNQLRRSARAVQRKSYVELITPEKFTPQKRSRNTSTDEHSCVKSERPVRNCVRPIKYNDDYCLEEFYPETPKRNSKAALATEYITPRRRGPSTPMISSSKKRTDFATPSKKVVIGENITHTPKTGTPKGILKNIREGVITPSMHKRDKAVKQGDTPLIKARSQLHVSHVPTSLPCREKEFSDILNFLDSKLSDGCGGCIYISGVPGTGKTATVTSVIKSLQEKADDGDVPPFDYVSINGMRLTEPRQAYVEILKQLTGKTVLWEQAQTLLDTRFCKPKKNSKPVIMLVDELDILCTKRQDVVYNLLDWPTKANNQLIVVTVANTMDLPERLLMGRVTSRLGLTRLTFQPYTFKQLQEIVVKRLEGTDSFNPDAVQLVARKVASVSGDARRALDICRRAAEIAEIEGAYTLVSMAHVNEALNAMITQPKVQAIKHCSRLEKLILQSVVAEVERTGVEETTFHDVYTMMMSVASLEGLKIVSRSLTFAVIAKLGACRLLLTDQKNSDMYQKIILNVSADDVYYALRQD